MNLHSSCAPNHPAAVSTGPRQKGAMGLSDRPLLIVSVTETKRLQTQRDVPSTRQSSPAASVAYSRLRQ